MRHEKVTPETELKIGDEFLASPVVDSMLLWRVTDIAGQVVYSVSPGGTTWRAIRYELNTPNTPDEAATLKAEVERLSREKAFLQTGKHNAEAAVAHLTKENAALAARVKELEQAAKRIPVGFGGPRGMWERTEDKVFSIFEDDMHQVTIGLQGPGTFAVTVEKKIG